MDLTDQQWEVLEPLIPDPTRSSPCGRTRQAPARSQRHPKNGILWVLRTGAPWKDLPERYPPYQTCHRRFQRWVEEGTLSRILEALALDLKERGDLDLSECFIGGTFVVAKKGGSVLERPSGAKVRSSWRLQTALLFLSPSTQRVLLRTKSPLLERLTLCERFVEGCPSKLVGHRAYDSDHLDAHLEAEGIEMISPHRRNRKKAKTQDGRKLRRYRRRWKVERLFAWLGNFRGLVVRYERRVENYLGFPCTSGASSSC